MTECMNGQKPFSRVLPYLVAFVTFLSVCLISFSPLLDGRKLPSHDIAQYEGMRQDILEHQQKYGEDPQWAGRMFGGMPASLISVKYDSRIIKTATSALEKFAQPLSLILLAMLCFFIMTQLCGINPWVGIIPSLAYGLSTYFFLIIGAGHITKMVALAYVPMMLGGVFYAFRKDLWMGAALTALFGSIEIAASHPQITYYFGMVVLAYWIAEFCLAIREKWVPRFLKTTGALILAAVLALGSNFVVLENIQSYSKQSMRGGSELKAQAETEKVNDRGLDLTYATAWSYGKVESFNMLIPDLMGGGSQGGFASDGPVARTLEQYKARELATQLPAYWGEQPGTAGPTYLGAVMVFLAVLAMFLLRGRYKWWIAAVSLVALLLAWGSNFMWFTKLFFDFFPGYDKFRSVATILVVIQWSVPMLAAMGLYKIWRRDYEPKTLRRAILNALYITGGAALFFALLGGALFDFTGPADANYPADLVGAMQSERVEMLRGDAWRSLLFVALAAALLWCYMKEWTARKYVFAGLAILVVADLLPVDKRFLPNSRFVQPRQMEVKPTAADRQILADTTPGYRVANFAVSPFNDASTSYFHRSVGGYHGAKLQRYQDVIERYLSMPNFSMEVYNMLNTKYFITSPQRQGGGEPVATVNPEANGAAWFVADAVYTSTPDEEIAALGRIATKQTAVLDRSLLGKTGDVAPGIEIESAGDTLAVAAAGEASPADSADRIALTDYRVNRLTYRYRAAQPRLAVFSEIYYKDGWSATIDGRPLDYFRADYILRAAVLPAGEHEVVFSYAIPNFKTYSAITLVCSILILLGVVAAWAVPTYLCKKKDEQQTE